MTAARHEPDGAPSRTAEKKCSRCGEIKPRSEFHRHAGRLDGLTSECKVCKRAMQRNRDRRKNRDTPRPPRKRRPLPDSAKDAAWQLRKDLERVERIFADDRFAAYEQQVAAHLHGHLKYAAEVCQDLLNRLTQTGD